MTALIEAAPAATAPARPAVPRRTRALVVVLAVGSVALLTLSGLRAAAGTTSFGAITPVFGGTAPVMTLPTYGPQGMHVVGYEHGATAELSLPIRNDGRLPVTVTSVALDGGVAPLLAASDVTGLPLSLGPGETGRVDVTAVLGNCKYYRQREAQSYARVDIGFSVLGQERTQTVAFDRPVTVYSPMIVGCPDRLLDRESNDRSDLTGDA